MYCDGVNKYFILYYACGSTHFNGCRDAWRLIEESVQLATSMLDGEQFDMAIARIRQMLDTIVEHRRSEDETDLATPVEHRCKVCYKPMLQIDDNWQCEDSH